MPSLFRNPIFLWGCLAIIAVALGFVVWSVAYGLWIDFLIWAAIAAAAGVAVAYRDSFPPLLGFLLALATAVNGAGYSLALWNDQTFFDEAVHAFTAFAGMSAIGWAICRQNIDRNWSGPALFAAIVVAGFAIGLLWEGFEWLIGIMGGPRDTLIDLVADAIGAVAAAALISPFHSPAPADGNERWDGGLSRTIDGVPDA